MARSTGKTIRGPYTRMQAVSLVIAQIHTREKMTAEFSPPTSLPRRHAVAAQETANVASHRSRSKIRYSAAKQLAH